MKTIIFSWFLFLICPLSFSTEKDSLALSYLYDKGARLSLEDIIQNNFQPMPTVYSFGLENGLYWFRLSLQGSSADSHDSILEIPTHNISSIALYQLKGDSLIHLTNGYRSDGDKVGIIRSNFPTFRIKTTGNFRGFYFIKVDFKKEANFPIRLYNPEGYYSNKAKHKSLSGIYYGILVAVIIFNLFFFWKFHESVYLYYVLFLSSYSLAMLLCDGMVPRTYWSFEIIDGEAIIHLLVVITMLVFSYKFLDLKRLFPAFRKFAYGFVIVMAVSELIYLASGNYLFFAIGDIIAVLSFLFTLGISIRLYKKLEFAKFYILGYIILIVYSHYHVFGYDFGIYAIDGYQKYFKVAGVVDMLIFTYAIGYRLDLLNRQHREIIKELKVLLKEQYPGNSLNTVLKEKNIGGESLTLREMDVLKCVNKGFSNSEIADKLFISPNTVKFHIRNIYQKLDVRNRVEVIDKLSGLVST